MEAWSVGKEVSIWQFNCFSFKTDKTTLFTGIARAVKCQLMETDELGEVSAFVTIRVRGTTVCKGGTRVLWAMRAARGSEAVV